MKVNAKLKRFLVTCLILAGGYIVCGFLYVFLDQILNGFMREWIERNFIYTEWMALGDADVDGYFTQTINWGNLKRKLFAALIILIVAVVLIVRLVSILYASRQVKAAMRDAGRMIDDYMRQTKEAVEVFPQGYEDISVRIVEIKADMQRNEQIMREEANRKNDLITYLAHDLKTPLTSVIGYLSLMDEAPDMPAAQRAKYVHITLDKALRLEKLINEFFEITRYNLQQIALEKETVNLSFMLEQMTDEFYPLLSEHGNTIRLEIEPDQSGKPVTLYADGEKLARVFNNILKNAIAYSYPGTAISVECRPVRGHVRIVISNRGKTIPPHKLEAIFEKFFRLDDARATNTGGAGLGLAIAKEIVTLHNGIITARSEDEVTSFQVELPLSA
ncbi:sensor histidine kinase [Acetatifactor aquisgranensis]|uniref:sensor histidine kinase n=1 Tax=Acetatifactor aquisgranensis TaxID=2941233 RepID=UPI00203F4858|nr:HAMP domain-containing sensor histidine kinase [Acetatifactor aquisgranensis]